MKNEDRQGASAATPSMTKILDRMRRLCSRREYCSSDIRSKVEDALSGRTSGRIKAGVNAHGYGGGQSRPMEIPEQEVRRIADEIMASLMSDRYIDDLRYATAFARDKSSLAGWGETKIRYSLAAKKIDKDIISAALGEIDSGKAADRLERLVAAKLRSLGGVPGSGKHDDGQDSGKKIWEIRQKLLRHAISRGYSFDDALPAIDRLLNEDR
ncbi:MAG: RecX family transcriptional regulator [Bacteroides sp.]|nr:RecX family transcriptional regulator [Bacteroides sp.]